MTPPKQSAYLPVALHITAENGMVNERFDVLLDQTDLRYTHQSNTGPEEAVSVRPSASQWRSFRMTLERIGALGWSGDYTPGAEQMVTDSSSWAIDVRWSDGRSVVCDGYHIVPPRRQHDLLGDLESADSESREWNVFCRAVSRLVEGREFAWLRAPVRVADAKGSRRQVRKAVLDHRAAFEDQLRAASSTFRVAVDGPIDWVAPQFGDEGREFGSGVWNALGLPASPQTDRFWPERGPVWDAAGIVDTGQTPGVVLVEAKSHIGELRSSPVTATGGGLELIERSLNETKAALGVYRAASWSGTYYQLANRLATLYWLRQCKGVEAWLFNVYFLGDRFTSGRRQIIGPTTAEPWRAAICEAKAALRLPEHHLLCPYVADVFVPVVPTE